MIKDDTTQHNKYKTTQHEKTKPPALILVIEHVARAVDGLQQAQQLRHACQIVVELHREARGRVAVRARIDEAHLRHGPVVRDRVHARAVGATGTRARACRAGRGRVERPVGVPCARTEGMPFVSAF